QTEKITMRRPRRVAGKSQREGERGGRERRIVCVIPVCLIMRAIISCTWQEKRREERRDGCERGGKESREGEEEAGKEGEGRSREERQEGGEKGGWGGERKGGREEGSRGERRGEEGG